MTLSFNFKNLLDVDYCFNNLTQSIIILFKWSNIINYVMGMKKHSEMLIKISRFLCY